MTVRTRMAPSPTGEYHIGHIRTLLYNFAFSKKNKGKFLMRIEDTDRNRLVEGATEKILDVVSDYGFSWDEGPRMGGDYGPYIQSERLDLYKKHAEELVEKGFAYYCFCSPERLKKLREEQQKNKLPVTKYDKRCLSLTQEECNDKVESGEKSVIRLNVPKNKDITFKDEVYGEITINSEALDDQILLKSDGFPSYHLAVVVDDNLMEITHVMRGNDWLSSTPKHVLLYEAFDWKLPVYIHLPNLKELGGTKKLSKRFGPVNAVAFLESGYLPEALLNFLMLLGWNPGTEKEIFSLDEFISDFSLERIHKTDLVAFDREKLLWYNGHYIRQMSISDLHEKINDWATKFNKDLPKEFTGTGGKEILEMIQERLKVFEELPELISYFYEDPQIDQKLLVKFAKESAKTKKILVSFEKLFSDEEDWSEDNLDKKSHKLLEDYNYTPKEAFMTLRVAVSGVLATPPIFQTLKVLGKEKVLRRINTALGSIDSK